VFIFFDRDFQGCGRFFVARKAPGIPQMLPPTITPRIVIRALKRGRAIMSVKLGTLSG
jgi:hypothetical protein